MHTHGGGYGPDGQGGEYQKNTLKGTRGCIRIFDDDIQELQDIVTQLEKSDPDEKPTTLVVEDDLEEPLDINKDRENKG